LIGRQYGLNRGEEFVILIRVVSSAMCRYAFSGPYKQHYACFSCRKAFKQPPISDWLAVRGRGYIYDELILLWSYKRGLERREEELGVRLSALQDEYGSATRTCPECQSPMIDMGLDFKPPRQTDEKAWRLLHGMYRAGHEFHTCGCMGPGFIPQSTADYRQYLQSRQRGFSKQLEFAQKSVQLCAERKKETCDYWADRIARIDAELAKLG
jgi:hypothetical protein